MKRFVLSALVFSFGILATGCGDGAKSPTVAGDKGNAAPKDSGAGAKAPPRGKVPAPN